MLQFYKSENGAVANFFFLNKHHLGSVISSSKVHVKHLNSFFYGTCRSICKLFKTPNAEIVSAVPKLMPGFPVEWSCTTQFQCRSIIYVS